MLISAQKIYKDFAEIEYRLSGLFFILNKESYGFTHLINGMKIDYEYHSIIAELFPTVHDNLEVQKLIKNYKKAFELYQQALEIIRSEGKASTSFLQRKLQIGYNRAARIIDMMEADGIVSKANHVGKRDVL